MTTSGRMHPFLNNSEIFRDTAENAVSVNILNIAVVAEQGRLKPQAIFWQKSRCAHTNRQGNPSMDDIDKQILNRIQSDFPIVSHPYREIAKRFNISENEVIQRIKRLKDEGIIRRIGGNFHSSRLHFTSTLCAASVPEEKIEHFVEVVNQFPGVTHNYLRNHAYNVWFTFIAENKAFIENALNEISRETGVSEILNLPAEKTFKIKVDFDVN